MHRHKVPVAVRHSFTLIELLVVLAMIMILAGMLLPALTRAKATAQQIDCLSNYRQLQLCWLMYADDYQDVLPPNATTTGSGRETWIATADTWISGNAWTDANTVNIEKGVLFRYHQSVRIYKCPADRSSVRDLGQLPRVRSVSMSSYMNDVSNPADKTCWHRLSDIRSPPPVRALVFVDEHQNSIENARFVIRQPEEWRWVDFPATRHDRGCTMTFADGHAEHWRWIEPNTLAISQRPGYINGVPGVPGKDRDLQRVYETVPRIPIE
jgi:prepilin-type processing-associated H-X9-DG protein